MLLRLVRFIIFHTYERNILSIYGRAIIIIRSQISIVVLDLAAYLYRRKAIFAKLLSNLKQKLINICHHNTTI
jgi:hypothetical protein